MLNLKNNIGYEIKHTHTYIWVWLCNFLNDEPQTTPHRMVLCDFFTSTCGIVQLLHFEGDFGWFRCGPSRLMNTPNCYSLISTLFLPQIFFFEEKFSTHNS